MKSPVRKITVDGKTEWLPDEHPDLDTLQEAVGGYIEAVYLGEDIMIVDEEGLLKSKRPNPVASRLAARPIVGDVVIMPDEYLD